MANTQKKRSLRNLKKLIPGKAAPWDFTEGLTDLTEELNIASDRAAAILGGALVEMALRLVIFTHLPKHNDEIFDRLTDRDGALSSLFPMIALGEAMGLLSEADRDDLNVIRHVRNAFAHSVLLINFQTKEIVSECAKIKIPTSDTVKNALEAIYNKSGKHNNARIAYLSKCVVLTTTLLARTVERQQKTFDELSQLLRAAGHNMEKDGS